MATATMPAFPIDNLLTCAICQGAVQLGPDPEPRYTCQKACLPAYRPGALNRLLLSEITQVIITESTLPMLLETFFSGLPGNGKKSPSDDQIRQIATDPDTYMAADAVVAAAELLAKCIHRIELDTRQATVQYAVALPPGSHLAGSTSQQVLIPGSVSS